MYSVSSFHCQNIWHPKLTPVFLMLVIFVQCITGIMKWLLHDTQSTSLLHMTPRPLQNVTSETLYTTRWNSTGCRRRSYLHLLWPWPLTFWSQYLTSTSTNWSTSVTTFGWNSFHWFLRYGVHNVFGMYRLMHLLTHRQRPNRVCLQHCFSTVAKMQNCSQNSIYTRKWHWTVQTYI